eukprot:a176187_12.p4 GENE.a176187_12~~a176187_12.p4  ORF type:complete len:146 (-),score=74.93 a176187_12:687-1100(-)
MVDARIAVDAKPFMVLLHAHAVAGDVAGIARVQSAMRSRGLRFSLAEYRNKSGATTDQVLRLGDLVLESLERQDIAFLVAGHLRASESRASELIARIVAAGKATPAELDAVVQRHRALIAKGSGRSKSDPSGETSGN